MYGKLSRLRPQFFADHYQILYKASLGPRKCSKWLRFSILGRGIGEAGVIAELEGE